MAARGRFITFEGGEGAGKSTHLRRLAAWLAGRGVDVLTTREPGGTPGGEALRALLLAPAGPPWSPLSEVLLHYAARCEHIARAIEPALARGCWVLCDRFADSTMAYQGYGLGVDRALIAGLHRMVVGDFAPDLTVVLDVAPEEGRRRAGARAAMADRYEAMAAAVHEQIRAGFLAIAAAEPARCVVIDAVAPVEVVAGAVQAAVAHRFAIAAAPP